MSKRRSFRGLSGSPVHHRERGRALITDAQSYYNRAAAQTASSCSRSVLQDLIAAAMTHGEADAHFSEVGTSSFGRAVDSAQSRAIKAFEKNCMRGGGSGLYGLAGRRRRRR